MRDFLQTSFQCKQCWNVFVCLYICVIPHMLCVVGVLTMGWPQLTVFLVKEIWTRKKRPAAFIVINPLIQRFLFYFLYCLFCQYKISFVIAVSLVQVQLGTFVAFPISLPSFPVSSPPCSKMYLVFFMSEAVSLPACVKCTLAASQDKLASSQRSPTIHGSEVQFWESESTKAFEKG